MGNQKLKRLATQDGMATSTDSIQTTLRLSRRLYERAACHAGRGKTGSVNDFIVKALAAHLEALEREAIDETFCGMAKDKRYQREALQIVEQFGG